VGLTCTQDVSDEKQVQHLVAETIRQFGWVDLLVNNSGVLGPTAKVVAMELSQWNETRAIDLTGSMLCAREVLKHMIPRNTGVIINIVSEGGRSGDGRSGYPLRIGLLLFQNGPDGPDRNTGR
jgi:NAD(P)-dependent dehydrogenase (short-subunit alcohol dehydrogenase family)